MTTNAHTAPASASSHHGRTRRIAAIVVMAGAAWVGVNSVTAAGHAAPGPQVTTQAAVSGPQATTDWLASANR